MAATPAGASRALRHPDAPSPSGGGGDEDERSVWEMAFDEPDGSPRDDDRVAEAPASDAPSSDSETTSLEAHGGGPLHADTSDEEPDEEGPGPVAVLPGAARAGTGPEGSDEPTTSEPPGTWSAVDDTAPEGKAPPERQDWRAYRWSIVAAVVVLALVAGVVVFAVQWFGQRSQEAQRDAASAAARQMAVNLTSLNFNQIDGQVRQIIDQTTGDFRNQFTENAEPFSNIVRVAKVETTSDVVASGVQTFGDGKARVLVAVRSTVKNTDSPQPQVRNYRMAVDLEDQADQWLTSNVEFVP